MPTPRKQKTLAIVTNTNGRVWHLTSVDGQLLSTLEGVEERVLSSARATLISDAPIPANLADGSWVRRGPGRFSYVVDAA